MVFDGEVVMSLTLPDQRVGDLAVGQPGIGGNGQDRGESMALSLGTADTDG